MSSPFACVCSLARQQSEVTSRTFVGRCWLAFIAVLIPRENELVSIESGVCLAETKEMFEPKRKSISVCWQIWVSHLIQCGTQWMIEFRKISSYNKKTNISLLKAWFAFELFRFQYWLSFVTNKTQKITTFSLNYSKIECIKRLSLHFEAIFQTKYCFSIIPDKLHSKLKQFKELIISRLSDSMFSGWNALVFY